MKGIRILSRTAAAVAAIAAMTSCGNVVRDGRAPVFLVIDKIQGIRGAASAGTAGNPVFSDVFTIVTTGGTCTQQNPCPTIFADTGVATLRLSPKDIGAPGATVTPSTNNEVTINRVHVSYRRTDGRNQEGVDVPFGFDSAATFTVPASGTLDVPFLLVRSAAKEEMPLVQLRTSGLVISTIADVTFYGADQVGNQITASGTLQIEFSNFGDQ